MMQHGFVSESTVVKDKLFQEVSEVKVDAKHRVALGEISAMGAIRFKVYRNSLGQYLLDPQVSIPAHELWLFRNPKALGLVQKGLQDIREGRVVKAKEDYSQYAEK